MVNTLRFSVSLPALAYRDCGVDTTLCETAACWKLLTLTKLLPIIRLALLDWRIAKSFFMANAWNINVILAIQREPHFTLATTTTVALGYDTIIRFSKLDSNKLNCHGLSVHILVCKLNKVNLATSIIIISLPPPTHLLIDHYLVQVSSKWPHNRSSIISLSNETNFASFRQSTETALASCTSTSVCSLNAA